MDLHISWLASHDHNQDFNIVNISSCDNESTRKPWIAPMQVTILV